MRAWLVIPSAVAVFSAFVAGCGVADSGGRRGVDLVVLAGYVEDGSSDPEVDWVSDFEARTGCEVRARTADSSEHVAELFRTGEYDVASVPGDVSADLIATGDVAALDTDRLGNYGAVVASLRGLPHNSLRGRAYGVPAGRGANLLMYRSDLVVPPPASWRVVFEPGGVPEGKATAYGSAISIADAALYLRAARPALGIRDPYELDDAQFRAAVALADRQRDVVGLYWTDSALQRASFAAGDVVVGSAWRVTADALAGDGVPVETVLPREGATGWSDTWMISSAADDLDCAYRWLDHVLSPAVNAAIAEWYGLAPSNTKACALTRDRDHCAEHRATDEAFYARVAYWTTPQRDCGDGRGPVCKTWAEWVEAWDEIHE